MRGRGGLSPRDIRMMQMTSEGMTSTEIGRKLGMSQHAVNVALGRAYELMGARGKAHAVAICYDLGILVPKKLGE